jgi:hypothetical protein
MIIDSDMCDGCPLREDFPTCTACEVKSLHDLTIRWPIFGHLAKYFNVSPIYKNLMKRD